jgi:outer membrane lipoprotein-sorting protein
MTKFLMIPLLVAIAVPVMSQTPQEKGLELAVAADKRGAGFVDSQSSKQMTLINKQGKESQRSLRVKVLEGTTEGDKSLTIFDTPRDQKGTALLTYTHKDKSDDQWLFLPALKRVKKISSRNKSGPFVGSEFAFEDIGAQEVEKYTYLYVGEESVAGLDCYKLERFPTDKYSGYTRQIVWMEKEDYRVVKVEYYDRKKSLLKTLEASEWTLYNDKFWRSHKSVMTNHQTGKSTRLNFSDYKFSVGLKSADFTKNSLKRVR